MVFFDSYQDLLRITGLRGAWRHPSFFMRMWYISEITKQIQTGLGYPVQTLILRDYEGGNSMRVYKYVSKYGYTYQTSSSYDVTRMTDVDMSGVMCHNPNAYSAAGVDLVYSWYLWMFMGYVTSINVMTGASITAIPVSTMTCSFDDDNYVFPILNGDYVTILDLVMLARSRKQDLFHSMLSNGYLCLKCGKKQIWITLRGGAEVFLSKYYVISGGF